MHSTLKIGTVVTLVAIALDVVLYALHPLGDNFFRILDWAVVLYALAAVITGISALRFVGAGSDQGKALLFLIAGGASWMLGEFSWAVLETLLNIENPLASIADVFWYAGYVFFAIGLYKIWNLVKTPVERNRMYPISVALVVLILLGITYATLPLLGDMTLTLIQKAVILGYVPLDFILLGEIIIIFFSFVGGGLVKPWLVIFASLSAATLADILYAQINAMYQTANFFGVLWDIQYILLTFGYFYYRQTIRDISTAPIRKRGGKFTASAS